MGKAAKAHRAKVAKRNANLKVQEKRMQKVWQEAFQEQMDAMKQKFEAMSGETGLLDGEDKLDNVIDELNILEGKLSNEDNIDVDGIQSNINNIANILDINLDEEKSQEGQESTESVRGE
jgi:hypothetical protein